MKTYLDCIPCFMSQTLRVGRAAKLDEKEIKALLDAVGMSIKEVPMKSTPPETAAIIYQKIREVTGISDPFAGIKQENIRDVLALYPGLKETVKFSRDPLLTAIRMAIAGNVMDFGVNKTFDLNYDIKQILKQDFAIFDYETFKRHLKKAKFILYLGDNAGESVFDRILIEEMRKPVTFVVRSIPVINDVTRKDAILSGLNMVADLISSGCTAPGIVPELCSKDFLKELQRADMIISKGQGNYEGLSDAKIPVFFLLKVKCPVIAKDIGVRENDIILKFSNFDSY